MGVSLRSLLRSTCWLLALAAATVLFGCGGQAPYRPEPSQPPPAFSRRVEGSADIVCNAVKRAMLNQGYLLEAASEHDVLTGTKASQLEAQMVTLRLQTSCMDNADGSCTVFASAMREVSELQELKQPTSVSVGPIGGITLPTGSARVPVTVRRETVLDADFYERLYSQIEELAAEARDR